MRRALIPALVGLTLTTAACDVLDPMMVQQKVKPYRPSDFYADGLPMRPAPEGTVAREDVLAPGLATGLSPDGTPLSRIPVPVTRATLALGRKRFEVVCAVCHGLVGDGDSLVARNMSLRPPPSLHLKVQNPDGWFFRVVSEGFGVMPSYASHLTVEERWAVVAYLRALQLSQRARLDQIPADERARLQGEKP